jgi:hypothetical protein
LTPWKGRDKTILRGRLNVQVARAGRRGSAHKDSPRRTV